MDSVRKQVGWDFCFRRFGCINWVFGRDDQSLLPGLLQLTSIQGLTPKTWILEPNDTTPLLQVEGGHQEQVAYSLLNFANSSTPSNTVIQTDNQRQLQQQIDDMKQTMEVIIAMYHFTSSKTFLTSIPSLSADIQEQGLPSQG